jgi:hypothetical protein
MDLLHFSCGIKKEVVDVFLQKSEPSKFSVPPHPFQLVRGGGEGREFFPGSSDKRERSEMFHWPLHLDLLTEKWTIRRKLYSIGQNTHRIIKMFSLPSCVNLKCFKFSHIT